MSAWSQGASPEVGGENVAGKGSKAWSIRAPGLWSRESLPVTEKKTHCYHLPTLSLCSPHIHPGRSSFKEAGSAHFQLGEPRRVTQSHRKGKSRLRRPSHMRWVPNLMLLAAISPWKPTDQTNKCFTKAQILGFQIIFNRNTTKGKPHLKDQKLRRENLEARGFPCRPNPNTIRTCNDVYYMTNSSREIPMEHTFQV